MPLGHLVDLIWRHKAGLVYLGAGLIAASVLIMFGLLGYPAAMRCGDAGGAWFVLSTLLAPIGYVLQDTVADAMTVEAVPRVDAEGRRLTRGRAPPRAHHDADAGSCGDHRRWRAGVAGKRGPVPRRRAR